jgi:hypothetical protein
MFQQRYRTYFIVATLYRVLLCNGYNYFTSSYSLLLKPIIGWTLKIQLLLSLIFLNPLIANQLILLLNR